VLYAACYLPLPGFEVTRPEHELLRRYVDYLGDPQSRQQTEYSMQAALYAACCMLHTPLQDAAHLLLTAAVPGGII
jgi:hypothetical protein